MTTAKELQQKYEEAEAKALKLQAKRDAAMAKVRDDHDEGLRSAVDEAAAIQEQWRDAEAAQALVGRDDAEIIAENLGLTLPD